MVAAEEARVTARGVTRDRAAAPVGTPAETPEDPLETPVDSTPGVAPDTTPPRVLVDPPSSQKLAKKIKLEVGCSEPCTVTVGGTLKTGKGKKGKSKLTPAESELAAGQSAVLKPKISKQGLKAAKKTVAKGKSVSAKLTVAVTDQAGNTTNDVIKEKLVGKR